MHFCSLRFICLEFAALLLIAGAVPAKVFTLDSARTLSVPRIDKSTVTFSLDLFFNSCPAEHWAFYDSLHRAIVIDCYGATIVPANVAVPRNRVFSNISIKNLKTELSLTNERSQISIGCDPGWHIEVVPVGEKVLRITVWRRLRGENSMKSSNTLVLFLSLTIPLIIALATVIIILSVPE